MEIQLTDFDNAAFCVFVMLLGRAVLALEMTLYIPISRLEENMHTAQQRDACVESKFWFRRRILPAGAYAKHDRSNTKEGKKKPDNACEQYSIAEILGGTADLPGLVPLCETYLDFIGADSVVKSGMKRYMDFILKRARGELMTPAAWQRKFITTHPLYKKDSRIPPPVAYDLMVACKEIGEGTRACPELLGDIVMPRVDPATNPLSKTKGPDAASPELQQLLDHFVKRAEQKRIDEVDQEVIAKKEELQRATREVEHLEEMRKNMVPIMTRTHSHLSAASSNAATVQSPTSIGKPVAFSPPQR